MPLRRVVFLSCLATAASEGQSALRGAVQADSSRRYIVGAEITIATLGRVARSSGAGRYFLEVLPAGTHKVVVRAIGYRPLAASLTIDDARGHADTVDVDFVLSQSTIELPMLTVVAEAEAPRFASGKMEDVERRRRLGFGQFVDRERLRRNEDLPFSLTLRTLLSIRMVVRPQGCGGGFAAASGRGDSFGLGGQPLVCDGIFFPRACYLAIYLDGARIWAWDTPEPPNLDDFSTSSLEGIEVYRGASELPVELLATGNQCGALLLWTRVGSN